MIDQYCSDLLMQKILDRFNSLQYCNMWIESYPRDRSGISFGRCSDLLGRDGTTRGTSVAIVQRITARKKRRGEERKREERGERREEKRKEERRVPPDSCTSTGGFVSDSSVSIGGGGADRYPYPVWAGLGLHPRSRLPGTDTVAASQTATTRNTAIPSPHLPFRAGLER